MASKKFSRLSIMLEAKDAMTKNLKNATHASESLQKSVKSLDNTAKEGTKGNGLLSKSFTGIGKSITGILPQFTNLRKNIDNVGRDLTKVGTRRTTFNQLADANAKLNSQLEKMNKELNKSNNSLEKMGGKLKSIDLMGKGFLAYSAITGLAGRADSFGKDALQNAMQQQYDRESMKIVVGKDKGDAFYNTIQDYASKTVYSPEEWAGSMRGIIRKAKNTDQLKKYMLTVEQLATIDPDQGLQGAAYAMRELASGNTKSLVNRFELQKKPLEVLKKITDPMKQAEMLSKILGDQTGFSAQGITKMKELPLMQAKAAENKVKRAVGQMGTGMVKAMSPSIVNFNKMFDEGKFTKFIQTVSKGLGNATNKVMAFGMGLFKSFQSGQLQAKAKPLLDVFHDIINTISEAWPNIRSTLVSIGSIIMKIAKDIHANWPKANGVLQIFFGVVKNISSWIDKHYEATKAIVESLGAAFLAYKALKFIEPMILGIGTALKLYREGALLATAAQWALNVAMDANPIGAVIIAISAMVAATVLIVTHWELVKRKTTELWNKLGWLKGLIAVLGGSIGLLVVAGMGLIANWDNIKASATSVWIHIENAFAIGVNNSIKHINSLIESMNKIPGVNIPTIKYHADVVSYQNDAHGNAYVPAASKGVYSPVHHHRNGLNYVPYDGYDAKLHKGERVLTSQQNKDYNKPTGVHVTGNTFIVRKDSDIDEIADALYSKLLQAKTAMG